MKHQAFHDSIVNLMSSFTFLSWESGPLRRASARASEEFGGILLLHDGGG
jgi:hypothetical protein